ncbi:MAG: YadA-like family protein, partial [Veillonella sp.]|uniref:YadA-like family protein n=1 Tax=Veillonella sp. TaxID=1926307 RepID=UPI00291365BE
TAGKATIGSSVIDGVNNTFTTGGANAVKLDGAAGTIKTGTVTVTGGTTNDITGLSNTTVTAADFATKGRAATEEQLKAVGEQTWQITADKDATTSGAQTGTKKDAKVGKNDKVQLIAGENMTVNQNERDFTFTLNKDLVKMNSATFLGTGSNKTVITGDSITQTAGTQTNTSTAGGNTVADGTKFTETTAAGQVIKDGAKTNTSTVDENTIVDGTKSNKSTVDGNTITDGTNTTATTSSSVTVKDNAGNSTVITKDNITTGVGANKVTLDGTAGKATIGSSIVDGVNNTFTTGGANAVKLDGVTGTIKTGTVTVTGGTTNDITGLSNTTVTAADFATKGRAATEEQLKAVGEQTWQITADKDATTSGAQTGTKKDAKVGKNDKVQLIAGENMTVNQNERDFTFTLNKDLVKMNSATFEATGGKTTVIKGDSIVQTDGTKVNTSTAGGNTVADGTKSTETTADGQVIKDGAKSNKSTVDSNVIDDGTGNVNTSNATSNTVTDGTNTTATTSSSVTVKDNAGNSTVITKDNITTGVGGNKITLDGTAGKATVGSSVVDGVNNTFTTGGTNAVKLDGAAGTIKTGTVTVTGGTTNDITGLSNTTVTAADFATKGRAATEEQLKAVGEQTWQITADKDATTSGAQTGTKKDAKVGKDNKVQLIAGENMTINQNERDFTFTLNKDLVKMNSATFLGTGSNTTVITGNSITQTAGTQTNTSTAGGNTVADGTKSTETTAAGQVIKDGAKSNKSTVDSNVIDDGNGNKNTSNATSNTITDGTNTSTITAGKANIGNIAVDGVNNKITMGTGANPVTLDGANGHLDGLTNTTWVPGVTKATTGRAATEDQLQQVSDAVGAGWKVNTGTVAGSSGVSNGAASTKVSSGEEVKLQAGDNLVIDQNGKTVSYSLNKDLTKMNSATFEATGGKTTVIKGDSIVQTDGGKTNTSNAAGNTVVDGNKSTATTAAGTTITDGAKTNTSTADKNVINDGAGNTNVSNATSNTLKNAAGDETKADAKGVTVKDAAGNNATFTKDGITITKTGKDTVSLTSNGLDNGKNKIVNVAAGVANTDAVNVGQLKEYAAKSTTELTANGGQPAGSTTGNIVLTKTTAADGHTIYDNKLNDKITLGTDPTKAVTVDGTTGTVTGLTNKTWTPGSIVSGRAATEDQLKEAVADSGWKAAVDKEGSGQSTVVGTSPEKIKAEETVTFKAGNNMMVTQTGKSISYAVNPELTDMKSATFKDAAGNTTVTNGNGITITPGSANPTNPHAGPVSLTKDGLNNGNNQIKGVAPGTDPTDAVNVSQLNASNANTSQAINQIAGEVQHVGAHAAAMAALKPIQYDPLEPTQVMAGVGNYRGETAAALGLAHYTNENTMFNVGVSVGGNHNMVNAGVTHKFGYSPEKKNIPDRYKAGPISSVYVMQDEVSSLKKENAEQKYVIADQAARLTTLEAENEQQRRELAETKKGLDDLKAAVDKLLASKG